MARIQAIELDYLQYAEGAAPETPAAGIVRIYAKTDGMLYVKNDAGVETPLGSAATLTAKGDLLVFGTEDSRLAVGADGNILVADSNEPLGVKWAALKKSLAFFIGGGLSVETGAMSVIIPESMTITEIRLAVDAAPTDASLIIDVNIDGTTAYTTQANRPTITSGNISATAADPDVTALSAGDKLSIDIDQVGSTVAGESLSVIIVCEVG